MELSEYQNEKPRRGQHCRTDSTETHSGVTIKLLFLSFGVLCITQAILNVSLRLAFYSSQVSPQPYPNTNVCNQTAMKEIVVCPRDKSCHCNSLQERFNALTRDKNLLENEKTQLDNEIRRITQERDILKIRLRENSKYDPFQRCPADWTKINSRCYFLSTEGKTWQASRQYCQNQGADLVVINSEQEQRSLYRLNGDPFLSFWIGLRYTNGKFTWVDGSALTESFWQSGQPNLVVPNNRDDCVETYHMNPVLATWNDVSCRQTIRWMCEKDPTSI